MDELFHPIGYIDELVQTRNPKSTPPHILKCIFMKDFFNLIKISFLPDAFWHNSVAPIRRQDNTWTNDRSVLTYIVYPSLCLNGKYATSLYT